jgi:hypothetical protein
LHEARRAAVPLGERRHRQIRLIEVTADVLLSLGVVMFRRVDDASFRNVVLAMLLVAGVLLVL